MVSGYGLDTNGWAGGGRGGGATTRVPISAMYYKLYIPRLGLHSDSGQFQSPRLENEGTSSPTPQAQVFLLLWGVLGGPPTAISLVASGGVGGHVMWRPI